MAFAGDCDGPVGLRQGGGAARFRHHHAGTDRHDGPGGQADRRQRSNRMSAADNVGAPVKEAKTEAPTLLPVALYDSSPLAVL